MPELPEVETIRRELEPLLVGRRVVRAVVHRPDIVGWPRGDHAVQRFQQGVKGLEIAALERSGKYLILRCRAAQGAIAPLLIIHLRLSGHLSVRCSRARVQRFERLRLVLSGNRTLLFIEPRVLGRVYLVRSHRLPHVLGGLATLGPEPIGPEFDSRYLADRIRHRSACIKGLLLDQRIAAGVGNIYSDEALFRAGIRPTRRANSLTRAELGRLASALRRVLSSGIRHMGTTMTDARYQRPGGVPGEFQKYLMVFDREGRPCRRCRTLIKATRVGNRTTRYCPECQS